MDEHLIDESMEDDHYIGSNFEETEFYTSKKVKKTEVTVV